MLSRVQLALFYSRNTRFVMLGLSASVVERVMEGVEAEIPETAFTSQNPHYYKMRERISQTVAWERQKILSEPGSYNPQASRWKRV